MRTKIFCGLFFFFLVMTAFSTAYGNTNTREYYKELLELAKKEWTNNNFTIALKHIKEVTKSAEDNNWIDLKIDAYNNMGVIYSDIFDYDKAMECFLSAYNMALKESDKKRELLLLNNIAKVYSINNEYSKAKEYFEKSYKIAIYLNDSFHIGLLSSNLASILQKTEEFDLADSYIDISLRMFDNYKDTPEYIISHIVKINNLYLQKKYTEAEQLGLSIWNQFKEMDYLFKSYFMLFFSKIYQEKGDTEKAIAYAHDALLTKPNLQNYIEIYDILSDLHQLNGNYSLSLQYKDSVIIAMDSLHKINNKDYLETNLIRFELINSEKELSENKAKQRAERKLFIVVIIFIFVLAMIFIWVLRIQSIRNKQQKIIAENRQIIAELERDKEKNKKLLFKRQLKEQEALALLEQERLSNENKQLAAKILMQSNRNELIENIIHSLSKIPRQSEDSYLQSVIKQLKMQLQESAEWDNFLTYFEQINPSFLSSLKQKHPDLTIVDIRFLSYLFLNFNTKEIASLLNISLESCKKKRQRLAAKMGVKTAKLYDYLLTI